MTEFEVELPSKESAGCFAQIIELDVTESVLITVAQEASKDYDGFYAQRSIPQEEPKRLLLVVRFNDTGVPMIKAEAVKLKAKWGTGEKRQKKKDALVEGSYTVDAQPRSPVALAKLLIDPEAACAREQRRGGKEDSPSAPQVQRLASLVQTTRAVMERIKADTERRQSQHANPWSSSSMAH